LATLMEGYWGMGSTVASHGVQRDFGVNGGPGGGGPSKPPGDKEDEMLEGPLGRRIESNLARLLNQAEQLLERDRMMVFAVAHALAVYKTMSGEDVAAIMEGTSGPLVDGRLYHTEQFATAAEAYHERALAAHRDHSAIDMPLPFQPVRPKPALVAAPVGAGSNGGGNGTVGNGNGNGAPPPMFIPPLPPSGTPYTPPGALYPPDAGPPPSPPAGNGDGGGNGNGDGDASGDGGGLPPLS
jgi:hypothetical protein